MFGCIGWKPAADLVESAVGRTVQERKVTCDLPRRMEEAPKVKTSDRPDAVIANL